MDAEKRIEMWLKGKILPGGKCICDFCGRKGKMAAMCPDEKTGELLVMCLSCDLKRMAKQYGISIIEARKKRKKRFDVLYWFQEVKYGEYLSGKGKTKFDSVEEFTKVSNIVQSSWNAFTREQRIGFEDKRKPELRKIFKTIRVEFT